MGKSEPNPIEPSISNDTEVDEDKVSEDPFSDLTRPHYPKVQVSWVEAMDFCQAYELESKAGKLPANYTYTLPTEAQWSFLAVLAPQPLLPLVIHSVQEMPPLILSVLMGQWLRHVSPSNLNRVGNISPM